MHQSNSSPQPVSAADHRSTTTSASFTGPFPQANHSGGGVASDLTSGGSLETVLGSLPTSDSVFTGTFSDIFDSDISGRELSSGDGKAASHDMVISPSNMSNVGHFAGDSPINNVKTKLCIEKEYVHVIYIDHSHLEEELEKRIALSAELARCATHPTDTLGRHSKSKSSGSTTATPSELRAGSSRSTARKMLTGESIRRLMKMVSPGSHRRRRSPDAHSSGSSISGDTLTGSTRSLSGVGEPSDASRCALDPPSNI